MLFSNILTSAASMFEICRPKADNFNSSAPHPSQARTAAAQQGQRAEKIVEEDPLDLNESESLSLALHLSLACCVPRVVRAMSGTH